MSYSDNSFSISASQWNDYIETAATSYSEELSLDAEWEIVHPSADGSHKNSLQSVAAENLIGDTQQQYQPYSAHSLSSQVTRLANTVNRWAQGQKLALDKGQEGQFEQLAKTWTMLSSSKLMAFIDGLRQEHPFNVIHDFYLSNSSKRGINGKSFEEVASLLNSYSSYFLSSTPLCIPTLFSSQECFRFDHVATILIKDNIVEYFDPLGIASGQRFLQPDNKSFCSVLELCKELSGAQTMIENRIQMQWDTFNCGIFACHFLYRRLAEQNSIMGLQPCTISNEELLKFRQNIIKIASKALNSPQEEQTDESKELLDLTEIINSLL